MGRDSTYWRVGQRLPGGCGNARDVTEAKQFLSSSREPCPDDFELKCEYKVSAKGNSGINYRSEKCRMRQCLAGLPGRSETVPNTYTGSNYEERKRTTLASQGEKTIIPPIQINPDSLQTQIKTTNGRPNR